MSETLNHEEELKKGCGKEVTRGAYSFTCGEFSRAGKTQLCPECKAILCMEKRKNNKERT